MRSILNPERVMATRLRGLLLGGGLVASMLSLLLACAWFLAGPMGMALATVGVGIAAMTAPTVSPAMIMRWHRAPPR